MSMKGSLVKFLLKLAVSAALLAFLLNKISVQKVVEQIRDLDPARLVLAVLVLLVSNVIGVYQWHRLLVASGVELPFRRTFRFYFVGLFFNNFLPANVGGDAVKIYDVTRLGSSVYQIVAVTLLDRLIGIFSLCLLATVAVLAVGTAQPLQSMWIYLAIFIGCMTPVLALYFIEPLSKVLRRVVSHLRPFSLHARGANMLDYLGEFKARKALILRLMLLSLVIQSLRVSTHIIVASALASPSTVSFSACFLSLFRCSALL